MRVRIRRSGFPDKEKASGKYQTRPESDVSILATLRNLHRLELQSCSYRGVASPPRMEIASLSGSRGGGASELEPEDLVRDSCHVAADRFTANARDELMNCSSGRLLQRKVGVGQEPCMEAVVCDATHLGLVNLGAHP